MKAVDWTDDRGCLQRSLLPDAAPDAQAPAGVPIGVEIEFGLDLEGLRCRLQNELRRRGYWTQADVRARRTQAPGDFQAAIQAVLKVDVGGLLGQYALSEREPPAK